MDGQKDFGVVTANMLQLDSTWKWTGEDGLAVASASESMLKYNSLTHGAYEPVEFTVSDCNRQPIMYVRELKHEEATQEWGRAYEYQILALNKSVTARTQVTATWNRQHTRSHATCINYRDRAHSLDSGGRDLWAMTPPRPSSCVPSVSHTRLGLSRWKASTYFHPDCNLISHSMHFPPF